MMVRFLFLLPVALFMAALLWVGPAMAEGDLPFALEAVVERSMPTELLLDAAVEAVNVATVTAKTSGTVTEINFDVNDFVKEGVVLLKFQGNINQAGLLRAKAGLAGANANLVRAEKEYQRLTSLFDKKMITASQMDQALASLDAAKASVDANQAQIATASEGVTDTIVRAPYSGYVVKRFIQLGETANVGTPLFSGMSMEKLRVQAAVSQTWMPMVRRHNQGAVLLPDGKRVAAQSLVFFPYTDEKSHSFNVRVVLPPNLEGVYPGTLVKAAFKIGENNLLLVPTGALVRRCELTAVYVVNGSEVTLRPVLAGNVREDNLTELISGAHAGEKVALDPVRASQYLQTKRMGGAL